MLIIKLRVKIITALTTLISNIYQPLFMNYYDLSYFFIILADDSMNYCRSINDSCLHDYTKVKVNTESRK